MKVIGQLLGRPLDECEQEVSNATEYARSVFHVRYGNRYGTSGSTFIDREKNTRKLLRSTFPRGKRLTASDLELRGFDRAPVTSDAAGAVFLDAFYQKLDQTNARVLDRDRSLQDATHERREIHAAVDRLNRIVGRIDATVSGLDQKLDALLKEDALPKAIRAAIAEPSLSELSELMKTRQADKALAYAERHIKAIGTVLEKVTDPENRYAEALCTHRQRLLFAAATAASWLGDIEAGRAFWRQARDLGSIDSKYHSQAAATLFNVGLVGELRHLVDKMDHESEVYRRAAPLLAYLDENWSSVDKLLVGARSADLLLMRVQARLHILDPKDAEAVQITAELIDQTDGDDFLATVILTRARLTLELLQLTIRGYTPLSYNRRPLIDNLVRRINVALESTEPDSLFRAQALGCLGIAAELLRDDMLMELFNTGVDALEENIRSSVFFLHDPALTPERIDVLETEGHVSFTQAAIGKATLYQASQQQEEVERELQGALFAAPDQRQRADVLRLLAQHLRRANRSNEAQRLIEITPLKPADRWLLRAENLPAGKTPMDLADEVKAFPLDANVIERLAKSTLSSVEFTSPEDPPPDATILDRAEEAVRWTTRLVEVLPSRSSRILQAQALYGARRYRDLLTASRKLDPAHAKHAAELEAWALVGLGRRVEAANRLIDACADHPDSERLAINASAILMAEGRVAQAEALLESRVTPESQNPDILVSYAVAIRAQDPSSRIRASRAFDLLSRAYAHRPDSRIAGEAWKAARAAQRKSEAEEFFKAMIADAPVHVVQTKADFYQGLRAAGDDRVVQIKGGFEHLAELVREDQKRAHQLDRFFSGHVMAYVDLFRFAGRPWERWAMAIRQFERRSSEGERSPGGFSVLADWPSARQQHGRPHHADDPKFFADQTAILTLGVLGPDTAKEVLSALGACYVEAGVLEVLSRDFTRIQEELFFGDYHRYTEALRLLRQTPGRIVNYSEDVASKAPEDPDIGPCRVDLGVAILYNALYVTDLDNLQDWSDTANRLRISSAVLLASLNEAGEVTTDQARDAAKKHPSTFEEWNTAESRPIPKTIVFDEYSILDWVETGLADVLGDRIKVGPWAWRRISEEAGQREAAELAHDRLRGTIGVLQSALDEGTIIEVEAITDSSMHEDVNELPNESDSAIKTLWSSALKSIRTAQANGLQLWADDRFYPLLLRLGGPVKMGPEIQAIRDPFVAWAENTPPISTAELLNRLSCSERLAPDVAQNAAQKLFSQGYRMAHPILLTHTLRQFPVPATSPLTPPFRKLVGAITEIPRYLSEAFEDFYKNKEGLIRVASMDVAERFIVGVWEAEGLSSEQRRVLADAFLEAVEHVFGATNPRASSAKSERTPVVFWRGVSYALQMMPAQDERRLELRHAALCWLGNAAASRAEHCRDIVRGLEDNVLDSLTFALKALAESGEEASLLQVITTIVVPAIVPLADTGLIDALDPLMRRTVGMLARLNRDGRIARLYFATADKSGTPLSVSEEENEEAAAEALTRALTGDPVCAQSIRATDLVFTYTRQAPKEWKDEGFPDDEQLSINFRCSLFTLLWADPPGLREIIVRLIIYHLSALDPALAYRILRMVDDLLSSETARAQEARDRLATDVLRSGYFDLQRELVHAVRRFSQYDAGAFAHFVGWIGEGAAHALVKQPLTAPVQQIGPLLVPMAHFHGRALLTNGFDDGTRILEHAQQLLDADNDPNEEIGKSPTLAEWLADMASLAENAEDPFVAAWALRTVLLVISATNQDPELNINGRVARASDWAARYMASALAIKTGQLSELEQRMMARRRLASATLLLAAFACSGNKHLQAFNQEDDPHAIWLDRVWLLATKLQVALIGLRGGLSVAAASATTAMQQLGLDITDIPALDAFDPCAFGSEGDDIGIALTLTAVLKVARQLPEAVEHPKWWTDAIHCLVTELADDDSIEAIAGGDGLDNRFGLVAPLRVRILAKKLIEEFAP